MWWKGVRCTRAHGDPCWRCLWQGGLLLLLLVAKISYLRNEHIGRNSGGRYDQLRKHPHTGSQNIGRKWCKIGACTDIPWYAVVLALRPLFIFICSSGLLSEANLSLVEQLLLKELVVCILNILSWSPRSHSYIPGYKYYISGSMKMDALNLLRLTSVQQSQRVSDEHIMGRALACCLENGQMGGVWNIRV